MGVRGQGRPAKPTTLKMLHGDRRDRINTQEPVPRQGLLEPSEWLDEPAQRYWRRLAPDLVDKGVLTVWDTEAFAVWCDAAARHAEAAQRVQSEGLTVTGPYGGVVKNPACQLVRDYAQIMSVQAARFGLTPSDRSQLKVERTSAAPADRLLS